MYFDLGFLSIINRIFHLNDSLILDQMSCCAVRLIMILISPDQTVRSLSVSCGAGQTLDIQHLYSFE